MKTKNRELTHALLYDSATGRWSCKCGYMLGRDGHAALYARCPMYQRRKQEASAEISISSTPHEKTQRKARRTRSGVSQKALDLFDL